MAVVVTAAQRASTDPVMQQWVAAKDKENAMAPPTAPAVSTAQQGIEAYKAANWTNGTANGLTPTQNQAAVINQPGNTTKVTATPYITPSGTTDYHINNPAINAGAGTNFGQDTDKNLGGTTDTGTGGTGGPPQSTGYDLNGITDTATKTINDKIAAQIAAYNQQLASSQQANLANVTQNNTELARELQGLNTQHTVDNSNAQELQNRRGGFYSGGLDYQLGSQDRAYATSEGNLNQDVANRNDAIYANNALLANQAAANIQQLQSQAPDMIRQAIQDEIDRQRGINIQDAGLTGNYNGQPTLAAQNQNFNQGVTTAGITGQYNGQPTMDATQLTAQLTGKMPDGTPTNAAQQQALTNAWSQIETLGYVPTNLAPIVGVPAGTQTAVAKQQAYQNSVNAAAKTAAATNKATSDQSAADQKDYQSQLYSYLGEFDNAADALGYVENQAGDIVKNLGSAAYTNLVKSLPMFYPAAKPAAKDTSAADETALRAKAVSLAQSDTANWALATTPAQKEALVNQYLDLLRGSPNINTIGGVGTGAYGPVQN